MRVKCIEIFWAFFSHPDISYVSALSSGIAASGRRRHSGPLEVAELVSTAARP